MKPLLEECFSIGYTTIHNFVNSEEKRMKEVFICQDPAVGRKIEFDWGEEKLFNDGNLRSFSLAVLTLVYSNDRFARLYESKTMVCVQDAHMKCMEHLGFMPSMFTYDNMRTVVKNFIAMTDSLPTGMKSILMLHYHFQIRLCQPRKRSCRTQYRVYSKKSICASRYVYFVRRGSTIFSIILRSSTISII